VDALKHWNYLMRTSEAIQLIDSQSQYISLLRGRRADWSKFNTWQRETAIVLERIYGPGSTQAESFKGIRYSLGVVSVGTGRDLAEEDRCWNQGLDEAQDFFRKIRDQVQRSSCSGVPRMPKKRIDPVCRDPVSIRSMASRLRVSYVLIGLAAFVVLFAYVRANEPHALQDVLDILFAR
jgi:hypothetical protein